MNNALATAQQSNFAVGINGKRAAVFDNFNTAAGNVTRPQVGFGIWGVNATWQYDGSGNVQCTVNAGAPTNNNFMFTEARVSSGFIISAYLDPSGTDTDKGFGFCFNAQDQFNNYRVTFHGGDAQGYSYAKFRSRYLDVVQGEFDITLYSEYANTDLFGVRVEADNFWLLKNGIDNSDVFAKEVPQLATFTRVGLASNFDLVSKCRAFSVEYL